MERCQALMIGLRARLAAVAAEGGSSIVEYILLVGLIAIVCLVALNMLGLTTSDKYSAVASQLASA
jgi:Flp pilus assembly pilin Flp